MDTTPWPALNGQHKSSTFLFCTVAWSARRDSSYARFCSSIMRRVSCTVSCMCQGYETHVAKTTQLMNSPAELTVQYHCDTAQNLCVATPHRHHHLLHPTYTTHIKAQHWVTAYFNQIHPTLYVERAHLNDYYISSNSGNISTCGLFGSYGFITACRSNWVQLIWMQQMQKFMQHKTITRSSLIMPLLVLSNI